MANNSPYSHYLQRTDISDAPIIDIEQDFVNIRYLKAEGMNNVGKAKNVYTETYADSERLRVYLPPTGVRTFEATVINMTFLVIGTPMERQAAIDEFTSLITDGTFRYWDTARNREFEFVVTDEIQVSDERWHGSDPYVEIKVPMQNLYGYTMPRN